MRKFAIILGLLLCAIPANADSIKSTGLTAILTNGSAFESIDSTMKFDRTTQSIVPGTVQTASFGALGAFDFSSFGVTVDQPNGPGSLEYLYSFAWTDLGGDTIKLLIANVFLTDPLFFHWNDDVFLSGPGFNGWGFASIPEAQAVVLFPDSLPTPEPSTLMLFGIGVLGLVIVSRKLIYAE